MTTTFNPDQKRGGLVNAGNWTKYENSDPEAALAEVPAGSPALFQRYDTLDEKLAAMSSEVEKDVAALADDDNWNAYLDSVARFPTYSFGNTMLIGAQLRAAGKGSSRVAGKKVWKSQGRTVLPFEERGAGISIFAPKKGWFDKKDSDGNVVTGPDGKARRELRTFGFTSCTVYAEDQTTGDALPELQRELTEEPPEGFVEDLEQSITAHGFTVSYEDDLGNPDLFGSTSGTRKTVRVKAGLTPGSRAQVLAHELGHIAAGHLDKTEKYHTGAGGQRGAFEVEAESVSHVLLRMNGMKTPGEVTATYIAGWAGVQRDDPDAVKNAGETVSKAVKDLIVNGSWRNVVL